MDNLWHEDEIDLALKVQKLGGIIPFYDNFTDNYVTFDMFCDVTINFL